jgi:hypothetical protein
MLVETAKHACLGTGDDPDSSIYQIDTVAGAGFSTVGVWCAAWPPLLVVSTLVAMTDRPRFPLPKHRVTFCFSNTALRAES